MNAISRALVVAASLTVTVGPGLPDIWPAAAMAGNDCRAGYVTFTFDDGPDVNTPSILDTMRQLGLQGVFFVLGDKLASNPANQSSLLSEVAAGDTIGNHSYDHTSFTGASTSTPALTDPQIQTELQTTSAQVTALGVAAPTLYRPPFGDVNAHDDLFARSLGYRIVMPWGTPSGNIVDGRDWTGASPAQIVSNVTSGYTANGHSYPGIKADSIIALHDGLSTSNNTNAALSGIVDYMNANQLCATATVRPDATGGAVPASAPPTPAASLNLVQNSSLEALHGVSVAPNGTTSTDGKEPVCFQQAGSGPAGNTASWSLTNDAHSGNYAEAINVSGWTGGDRKLVVTQRGSESTCLAPVVPGKSYSMWAWYKGNFTDVGSSPTKVSIATYYRTGSGAGAVWNFWQSGPLMPSTDGSFWNAAYFVTAPVPSNATAISFGLAVNGAGSLTTDDYFMAMN